MKDLIDYMPNLADLNLGGRIFMGLKSDPGCGKTIQAVSFAQGGEIYVFDCDNRMAPAKLFHGNQPYVKNIHYDTYWRNFPKLAQKLESMANSGKTPYFAVILDSLTALSDMIILQSLTSAGTGLSEGDKKREARTIGGTKIASMQDYLMESGALGQVLDALRGLTCHVIMTAHVVSNVARDQAGKPIPGTESRVLLTGGSKIAAKIPAYFDEFYQMFVEPGMTSSSPSKYLARTTHGGLDWAKTALPVPPIFDITNHDKNPEKYLYPQMMKVINGVASK